MRIPAVLSLVLSLCLQPSAAEDRYCENGHFTIDARYEAGAFAECAFTDSDFVKLTIRPEDDRVETPQPWFSFKVIAEQPATLRVRLLFPDAYARYWPKLSKDGENWVRAHEDAVSRSESEKEMDVTVDVTTGGTWVSAQELLTGPWYDEWLEQLAGHPELVMATIGMSHEGREIRLAKSKRNRREAVLLLGRQHPAEVPGAIAMRDFVDTVLGDSELARDFRSRFTLLIIPLVNPDGVANGHWRHNSGETDLNRDWGPFTQPETRSIARLMEGVDKIGMKPRLMLDFHATRYTESVLFYTQTDEDVTDPEDFAVNWLGAVRERIPDYEFTHDPRPTSEQPNTKGYFFTRYGIPSYTYEMGDEADRDRLRAATPVFAEEMMRTLLESD